MRVVVIGGGAAGFFGAIACAAQFPHTEVLILEAAAQPLGKVRISGGGRCNVTHHCFEPQRLSQSYPRGGKALLGPFQRFQPEDTVRWFRDRGVQLKTEADGRMFPITDDSATIVDCLLKTAQQHGITLHCQSPVRDLHPVAPGTWQIGLKSGAKLTADRVLLATGSNRLGYQWAAALGHHLVPPVPSLFTFNVRDRRLTDLAGIAVDPVQVAIGQGKHKLQQTGPLLITHWGVSGPAILKLSAWGARWLHDCHYQTPLIINWCPPDNPETLRQTLIATKQAQPNRQVRHTLPVSLPKRLADNLIQAVGIEPQQLWATVTKKAIAHLAQELTQGQFHIQGKGVFKEEFVTCGGIKLADVDFKTLASRKVSGLHFAGEILDIDGITGGFNFQNAWTTGWIAGSAIGL